MCGGILFIACKDDDGAGTPTTTGTTTGTTGETETSSTTDGMESDTGEMTEPFTETIRFVSYNVSMFRKAEGQLATDLTDPQNTQIKKIAEIIQHLRPDVLTLMEFDYDESGQSLNLFRENFLEVDQNGTESIEYPYAYAAPSNTGVIAEVDFDGNGSINLPNDAYGFGQFPGQYAFALLSKYPIQESALRTFRNMLWTDMPDAKLPLNADGSNYYSDDALEHFRLSSKNHVDLPIEFPDGRTIHALLAHPTPPVFDGAEDRNGKRNHDEIRLFADYIDGAEYLVDDQGQMGGLSSGENFVIMGDMNADPVDGDSADAAILQLLDSPHVNAAVATGDLIPSSIGGQVHNQSPGHQGNPAFDTSFFGLRIDYVLPSKDLEVINSGVFWPDPSDPLVFLIDQSDHLPVWVDLKFSE